MNRTPLDVLTVSSPCPAKWEEMNGTDRTRFCDHCQQHVHNLSAMPTDEARLLCEAAGSLCVRFERRPGGKIVTLDYQPKAKESRRLRTWIAALIAAALAGAQIVYHFRKRPAPNVYLGSSMFIMPAVDLTHDGAVE